MTTYQIVLAATLSSRREGSYSYNKVAEHEITLELPDYCLSQVVEAQLVAMMQLLLPAIAQSAIVERTKIKLLGEPDSSEPDSSENTVAATTAFAAPAAASLQP